MKNKQAMFFLFAANIISGFATGITFISIPWYLVSTMGETDGKFRNALMMGLITLTSLFWSFYVGTLIDKYNRKRIFQIQTVLSGTVLLVGASIGFYYGDPPFAIIAMVATTTIFTFNVHYPNLYAFVQELFEPKYYQSVNSAIELQGQVTNFMGMTTAGVFMAGTAEFGWWPESLAMEPWKLHEIFLMDGLTYFVSFSLISCIRYTPGAYISKSVGNVFNRIRQGLRFLWAHKPLLLFGICSHVIFFTLLVFIQVGMHVYVADFLDAGVRHGAKVITQFEGVYCLGAIVAGLAGLFLAKLIQKSNLIGVIIILLVLVGGLYFSYAFAGSEWLFIRGGFLVGICNSGARILRITYIVRIVPNEYVGRVNSIFQIINAIERFMLIFVLVLPFFSAPGNGENIIYALMGMGVICLLAAILLLLNFHKFDQKAAKG